MECVAKQQILEGIFCKHFGEDVSVAPFQDAAAVVIKYNAGSGASGHFFVLIAYDNGKVKLLQTTRAALVGSPGNLAPSVDSSCEQGTSIPCNEISASFHSLNLDGTVRYTGNTVRRQPVRTLLNVADSAYIERSRHFDAMAMAMIEWLQDEISKHLSDEEKEVVADEDEGWFQSEVVMNAWAHWAVWDNTTARRNAMKDHYLQEIKRISENHGVLPEHMPSAHRRRKRAELLSGLPTDTHSEVCYTTMAACAAVSGTFEVAFEAIANSGSYN
ncbi:hypothetical protein TrCOL_g2992 [Triparma columacea]|uniref:Uncharacterized protein n=1 Tax=Triparma columacea TaxID=722753 RepID=A0A9W7G067_9STRA|nr:hypothetical protein TrCOL_g2992 [Triparma columacea]